MSAIGKKPPDTSAATRASSAGQTAAAADAPSSAATKSLAARILGLPMQGIRALDRLLDKMVPAADPNDPMPWLKDRSIPDAVSRELTEAYWADHDQGRGRR